MGFRFSLYDIIPDLGPLSVVDIGAMLVGKPRYQRLLDQGKVRLTGFEPNPAEYEKLTAIADENQCYFPYFVGDGEPGTYHETNCAQTGSLYPPNTPLLSLFENLSEVTMPVAEHPVETRRLDDIDGIDDIDFLKIDAQGAELSILHGGEKTLSQVAVIQLEVEFVELYKGQPLFADVDRFLRRQGFFFHAFFHFGCCSYKPITAHADPNAGLKQRLWQNMRQRWRRLIMRKARMKQSLWSDAVYVRDVSALKGVSVEKLLKSALIQHDIYSSYDSANFFLQHADRHGGTSFAETYQKRLGVR